MNKGIVLLLSTAVMLSVLSGCHADNASEESILKQTNTAAEETEILQTEQSQGHMVEISVVTTFAGDDTNAVNYKEAVEKWEETTGNIVVDASKASNDEFKAKVIDDFENGSEPDVLFFFTGDDAVSFIEADQVVTLDEIRDLYPDYGSNMDESKLPAALNGKKYVIPVNGVWEGLYVNKEVLEAAGVSVPDAGYTWEQFLENCETIKALGKTPIAASFGSVPHYWFEFTSANYSGYDEHLIMPSTIEDSSAQSWIGGLLDMKELYDKGYLPVSTLYADESAVFEMFINGEAAFLIDGSWRMEDIARSCCIVHDDMTTLDEAALDKKYTVTYVPGKEMRNATDLIGGCTMGYYITRKAWEDPEKREAAVSFVEAMTTDEMVSRFSGVGAQALKQQPQVDLTQLNSLQKAGYALVSGTTSWTSTVLSNIPDECSEQLLKNITQVMQGRITPEMAVQNYLYTMQALNAEEVPSESQ